jgi:polar amino acid transport system substrate-binding protein
VAGSTTYGIVISKKNPSLHERVNTALLEMIDSGELKEIFERWGLWNVATAQIFNDYAPTRILPSKFEEYKDSLNLGRSWSERFQVYRKTFPILLLAAWTTIKVSLVAMVVAVLGGLVLVTVRLWGGKFFSACVVLFIEAIRGTPLLLQLFFVFYALPAFGIELSPFLAAVIGLGVNYSVQESEIYRSGLSSVHPNQIEAARILGFSWWQNFWYVQAPQAFRIALPPMTTDFIALIKDSSLVSVITMVELTKSYSTLAATYYDYFGFAVITAALYILIGMPLVLFSKRLEKRF